MATLFGKYSIDRELGAGGMAVVYRARDTVLGRDVALKVINERLTGGDTAHERFLNEARVIAGLTHPNIVVVYDLGLQSEVPFIAMEYLPGCDLRDLIDEKHPLSLEQKVHLMMQIAKAIDHAHDHGVIHRDIKPGNIRVQKNGRAKLMDFGIAKLSDSKVSRLTQTGMVLGSVSYMSPEQVRGGELGPPSDVFAFGVVFYELLTGRIPFSGVDSMQTLWKINFEEPEAFTEDERKIYSEDLRSLLMRCLAKAPELRFENLKPLIEQLSRLRRQGLLGEFAELEPTIDWVPQGLEDRLPPAGVHSGSLPPFQMALQVNRSAATTEAIAVVDVEKQAEAAFEPKRRSPVLMAGLLLVAVVSVAAATWRFSGFIGPEMPMPTPAPPSPTVALQPTTVPSEVPGTLAALPTSVADPNSWSGSPSAWPSTSATPRPTRTPKPTSTAKVVPTASKPTPTLPPQNPVEDVLVTRAVAAQKKATEARSRLGSASQLMPRLFQEAEALLQSAEADLTASKPDSAFESFSKAESVFRDIARLSPRVSRARDLESQGDYKAALTALEPIFEADPATEGPVLELRKRLEAAQQRWDSVRKEARRSLDSGDLAAAQAALAKLSPSEQALPDAKELLDRIQSRMGSDRQPPDLQVQKLDYKVGAPLVIEVRVIDTSGIASVTLYSECDDEKGFQSVQLESAGADLFRTQILPERHKGKALRYYLEAVDQAGNRKSVGSAKKPVKLKSEAAFSIVGPPG